MKRYSTKRYRRNSVIYYNMKLEDILLSEIKRHKKTDMLWLDLFKLFSVKIHRNRKQNGDCWKLDDSCCCSRAKLSFFCV